MNSYKCLQKTLKQNGFVGVSKDLVDDALKHEWKGSNFSKRVWNNQKMVAKYLEDNLMQRIKGII
ncbi:MAG: hypothetical protein GXY87_05190 [Tissierellia bacterium]|nr:hypothetical protein [Tissierellia bacterium]